MRDKIFIEILTPRQNDPNFEAALAAFAERYQTVLDHGHVVSVPDNPMGNLHFQLTEILTEMDLPVVPDQLLLHLNTFHRKDDLDQILKTAADLGISNLLVISGDGGERLSRLKPESLGISGSTVTSVELLQYVHQHYPGKFSCGVAFNQYEPRDHELEKLKRKIDAGASFVITQPAMATDQGIEILQTFHVPVAIGAWMSKKIQLLSDCIGYPIHVNGTYDPLENLKGLRSRFPEYGLYLALVSFKTQLPILTSLLG